MVTVERAAAIASRWTSNADAAPWYTDSPRFLTKHECAAKAAGWNRILARKQLGR